MSPSDKERASSPETPLDDLMRLAESHPREVLRNPLLPLLSLEDYTQWRILLFSVGAQLLRQDLKGASPDQRAMLAAKLKQEPVEQFVTQVKAYQFNSLKQQTEVAIQQYKSLEESFARLCPLLLFSFPSASVSSRARGIDVHLFETRGERVELPYLVVELWEHTGVVKSNFDHILNAWEQVEQMIDRGNLYIEVEQMIPLLCDCLLEELPWEELHAKYKHPTLPERA